MPAVQNIKSDTSEKSPKVFLAKSLNMNVQVAVHKFNTFQMIVQSPNKANLCAYWLKDVYMP